MLWRIEGVDDRIAGRVYELLADYEATVGDWEAKRYAYFMAGEYTVIRKGNENTSRIEHVIVFDKRRQQSTAHR